MAEITQAAEAAKAAARFQDAADALKKQAALVRDPAERERLWQAAYAKEKEAHGESKKARCKSTPRDPPHPSTYLSREAKLHHAASQPHEADD